MKTFINFLENELQKYQKMNEDTYFSCDWWVRSEGNQLTIFNCTIYYSSGMFRGVGGSNSSSKFIFVNEFSVFWN